MAAKEIKLYYFPTSYYSLKVLIALYEKDVNFKEQIVRTLAGEQNEDWFLKINRNGQVPVLEIGGEYVAESEVIVDIIDKTYASASGPKLAPDLESPIGKKVAEMRSLLDSVPVFTLTFGTLANPALVVDEIQHPLYKAMTGESVVKRFRDALSALVKKQETCAPELRDAMDRKVDAGSAKIELLKNEAQIRKILDNLDQTFDRISDQLQETRRDFGEQAECWLCGPNFTAADITATMLMFRLSMIGLSSRYFSSKTRPEVYAYYQKLMQKPSVMKMVDTFQSAKKYMSK